MSARVTIITRTKNRPRFLQRALLSVHQQSFPDCEHLIVNDGGDPSTAAETIEAFRATQHPRHAIRLLNIQPNIGMAAALNHGIDRSDSAFIAVHDDDDTWHPRYLKATTTALAQEPPECVCGIISKTTRILEEFDGTTFTEVERSPYVPIEHVSILHLGFENPFPPIAFLFHRLCLNTLGGFNASFGPVADIDFNFRALCRYRISVLPTPLAFYHWRTQTSSNAGSITTHSKLHQRLLDRFRNDLATGRVLGLANTSGIATAAAENQIDMHWRIAEIHQRLAQS